MLKYLGQGDKAAFGLEKDDVETENMPWVCAAAEPNQLTWVRK